MKISSFWVKIEEGTAIFKSDQHKEMFKRWLSQWNGKEVRLEVSEKKSIRSEQQNRYYWMYLTLVAEEKGYKKHEVEDLHSYLKNKFLTQRITEFFGDKTRITKSTTELSKGEFCEYLVNISELVQVELPDTTSYFGYSYHK